MTSLSDQFRRHFGDREHLYGVLLRDLADDLDAGGPTAEICRDHLDADRGAAIQLLRLLPGIFRIVLRGDAPDLERFYPVLGGTADPSDAWPVLRPVLTSHVDELHDALDAAPQTNEVGRSACLVVALFEAVRRHGLRRVRLLEPGASAGLNLNADRYRLTGPGWSFGPVDSPLAIDTEVGTGAGGVSPEEFEIVERRGCDLSPVDPTDPEAARYLTSFVWPFDLDRHHRLAAALEVARAHPPVVDRAPASTWLADRLAEPFGDDVLTVVWTSITQQYWPVSETDAVDAAIAATRPRIPIAHIAMEGVPPAQPVTGYTIAEHGPTTTLDGEILLRSHHHGPPLVMRRFS